MSASDLGVELTSFALAGRPIEGHGDFFRAFHRLFLKAHPHTGQRQVDKYVLLSRRIIEAIRRLPPQEQQAVRDEIFGKIIAPTGQHLEAPELDATLARLRGVMQDLIQRYGLDVDPADIPRPTDEALARSRYRQRQERVGAAAAEGPAPA